MILSPVCDDAEDEMQAMKNQFSELHRRTLDRQTSNQFLLRMSSNESPTAKNNDDQDEKRNVTFSDVILADNADEKATSDEEVAEPTVDEKDLEAMKDDFNKQQKLLLRTQIEKSFRIRSISQENNAIDDDEFNQNLSDIDDETEEKLMEDSEEMKMQFQQLNQRMIRMRSAKTLEMGMTPQIKPHHKDQFIALLQDIGIVNEYIIEQLWENIEHTVHQDDEFTECINGFQIEDDYDEDVEILSDIKEENEATPQKIKDTETDEQNENSIANKWETNIDEAAQSFTKILDDLNNAISSCKHNFSVSNIDEIGTQNVEELVNGNSMFQSKLVNCGEIVRDINKSSGDFIKSMEEMQRYIASKYIPNVKNCEQWDLDDICTWIKSLDNGRFVPYINILRPGFQKSHITNGSLLCDLNTADLGVAPFGIKNFREKRDLIRAFKSLNTQKK